MGMTNDTLAFSSHLPLIRQRFWCIVLMVGVLAPLLKRTDLLLAHVNEFREALVMHC